MMSDAMMSDTRFGRGAIALALVAALGTGCGGADEKKGSGTANEAVKKERAATGPKGAGAAPAEGQAAKDPESGAPLSPEAGDPTDQPAVIPAGEVQSALLFVRRGQYEQAIQQAKRALRKNEKYPPAMVVMARAYYHLNKLEFVDSICDIALSIDPTSGECLNLKGFVALKNENDPLARELFEKATKVKPGFGPAWLNLGHQLLKVKNYSAAVPVLEKAAALLPNRPEAHLNLGNAYRGQGSNAGGKPEELSRAQASFQKALALRPNYPAAYFNLGILLLDAATFPGMSKLQQLATAVAHFNSYKRQMTYLSKDDPVDGYIQEAQKATEREQRRLQREAQRQAREAAKKAAPAPAPAAAPGAKPAPGAQPAAKPQPGTK